MNLSPRLFSSAADHQLQPELMGDGGYRKAVLPILTQRGFQCELTGLRLAGAEQIPPGALRLEWRDPKAEHKVIKPQNVRVLDGLTYWCRHIDRAIEHKHGTLIFAPWLSQGSVLSLFRMAMIVKSDQGACDQGPADSILSMFQNLRQSELMVTALGLSGQVDSWDPQQWLAGIRDLSAKERKQYVTRFGQHVRFLPSVTASKSLAPFWRSVWGLPESGKTDTWQAKILKRYEETLQSPSR